MVFILFCCILLLYIIIIIIIIHTKDPANGREALIEASLDVAEGADFLMVKPGIIIIIINMIMIIVIMIFMVTYL